MSMKDFRNSKPPVPEGWSAVEGTWQCTECENITDAALYNSESGMVSNICEDHRDAEIYIGRGRGE